MMGIVDERYANDVRNLTDSGVSQPKLDLWGFGSLATPTERARWPSRTAVVQRSPGRTP
jgi:hypothetical protein